jgi:dehydrogenase/reductase SDR family protein 12
VAPNRRLAALADGFLETSIVGSFTKAGYLARSGLFDWDNEAVDLSGQTALITGGSSGIGRSAAEGLMALGAMVIVTSRSADRAEAAADELEKNSSTGTATGLALDTGSFESVLALVRRVKTDTPHIDMLLNNAGALSDSYATDDRGVELTLSTHLVGPYLLTKRLRDHLSPGGRIVWMSSGGMYTQGLDIDDIELDASNYKGAVAYAKAKRGQVEMVAYLGPRWAPEVVMHVMHPGWVDTPGVDSALPGFGKIMGPTLRTAEQGADTMVWLAAAGGAGAEPGQFWLDRRPRRTAYVPGTGTDDVERKRLIDWLDSKTEVS